MPAQQATNFKYTITVNGVTVNSLNINGTAVDPVKASDKVYADTGKPFFIELEAVRNSPTGTGTFQLKYGNKDVFSEPQELEFGATANGGLFLEEVDLP